MTNIPPEYKLTDEEIRDIKIKLDRRVSLFCSNAEGNFKPEEVEDIYDELPHLIADAAVVKVMPLIEKRAREETDKYRKALYDDASDLWRVTNAIKKEIESRSWIMEGRGSYEWDDDRYRQETKWAFESVEKIIAGVQHPAQLRFRQVMYGQSLRESK